MRKLLSFLIILLYVDTQIYAQSASQLTAQDTRIVATAPGSYSQNLQYHFKANATMGLPHSHTGHSSVLGFRPWNANTGGKSHELAFSDDGSFRIRTGFEPTWEAWRKIAIEDQNGNLGVGTASPLEKIHIQAGKLFIQSSPLGIGNSSGPILRLGAHYYSDWSAGLGITQGEGVDVYDLDFYTIYGTASRKMKLTAHGNLGIGTTSPVNKLQVGIDAVGFSGNDAVFANGNGSIAFYNAPGYTWMTSNQHLALQTSHGKNVGIGTTAPSHKLNIVGETGIGAVANVSTNHMVDIASTKGASGNSAIRASYPGGGGLANTEFGALAHRNNVWNALYAKQGSATNAGYFDGRVVIENGSLGIGTTNPGPYKLAVEGAIGTRKLKVTQVTPWADYVFEPTYQLPTLKEVEIFIKQHKHLPDVPSAKEVERDGLDVGDNQAVLLKKIEELTLYVIDLQKQIDKLQEKQAGK